MALTDEAVRAAETMLASLEIDLKLYQPILDDEPALREFSVTHRGNTIRAALVAKIWRAEGRQTLVMHPEVVKECRLAASSKIPLEVLRAIPYQNPMVVFAEPIVLPTWRNVAVSDSNMPYGTEHSLRLLGFMCYSYSDQNTLLKGSGIVLRHPGLTNDSSADVFGVTAICEVLDANGKLLDMDTASYSIPYDRVATLTELVDEQVERFVFTGVDNPVKARIFVGESYRAILTSLMYLASTTLDAEKVPARVTAKMAKRTIARKPLSLFRIGWTVGAALTRYRQDRDRSNPSQMGDIRHQQDPQHRRAHFKVVWSGPGRSIPKTAFIAPYWTHRERLGLSGTNTVRRVPKTG